MKRTRSMALMGLAALVLMGCVVAPKGASRELPAGSPESAGMSTDKLRVVDGVMHKAVADKKICGGIVMIAREGKVVFFNTYGKMDLESKRPMRQDAIFRIYSMSKAITSAAAMILVEEEKLGLDDPVATYIPEAGRMKVRTDKGLVDPKRPMTVRDLMRHTAGLSYGKGGAVGEAYKKIKPLESKNLAELGSKLTDLPLSYSPGESWEYSISLDVLGLVIERASGQRLDQFLSDRIFKPLDMPDTGFHVPSKKLGRFTSNYQRKEGKLVLIDGSDESSKYAKAKTFFSGGGGLVSTARDYMRFLMMVHQDGKLGSTRILSPDSTKLLKTNQLPPKAFPIRFGKQIRHGTGFGLAFSVRVADTEWDPAGRIGEYGWGGAASTHYWVSPSDDLIVLTLEQTMPYNWDTERAVKKPIYDAILPPAAAKKKRNASIEAIKRRQRIRAVTKP